MSQSTNAIIWWGVALDDEDLAERLRLVVHGDPDAELYGDGREWLTEHGLLGKVQFVEHCSLTYPMWGLALAGTVTTAYRGSPKHLGKTLVTPHNDEPLFVAVDRLGLDIPFDEYGWKIAPWWES